MNPNPLPQDIVPIAAAVVLGIASLFAVAGSSSGSSGSSDAPNEPTPSVQVSGFDTSRLELDESPYIARPGTRFQANDKFCTFGWHNADSKHLPNPEGNRYYTTSASCAPVRGVHGSFAKNSVTVLGQPSTVYASADSVVGYVPDVQGVSNLDYPAIIGGLHWRLDTVPSTQDFKSSTNRICLASENLNSPGMMCTSATNVTNTPGEHNKIDVTFEGRIPPGSVDGAPVFMVFPSGDAMPVGNVLGNSEHIVNVMKV